MKILRPWNVLGFPGWSSLRYRWLETAKVCVYVRYVLLMASWVCLECPSRTVSSSGLFPLMLRELWGPRVWLNKATHFGLSHTQKVYWIASDVCVCGSNFCTKWGGAVVGKVFLTIFLPYNRECNFLFYINPYSFIIIVLGGEFDVSCCMNVWQWP